MLIREVILENFMSYEYARVPLKDGVNVVCGPNGSGKSSFLVGICVALGDTYTERSKKLSARAITVLRLAEHYGGETILYRAERMDLK